jgi:hypothetical protein
MKQTTILLLTFTNTKCIFKILYQVGVFRIQFTEITVLPVKFRRVVEFTGELSLEQDGLVGSC